MGVGKMGVAKMGVGEMAPNHMNIATEQSNKYQEHIETNETKYETNKLVCNFFFCLAWCIISLSLIPKLNSDGLGMRLSFLSGLIYSWV